MWWTARELSREESELVHEMPPTVYGTKGWDKYLGHPQQP